MSKRLILLTLLPIFVAVGGEKATLVPPDPTRDGLLITAGFLTHHPDMKYRLLGMDAYRNKRYEDAMRFFRRASFYADKPSQGMVAEMLWNGEGAPRDPAPARPTAEPTSGELPPMHGVWCSVPSAPSHSSPVCWTRRPPLGVRIRE